MATSGANRGERNPVDAYVGARLRLRRTLVGMSQERLGDAVELTFQQIQKYEKGANRIGASRMYQFAKILDVPPAYFFEGIEAALGDKPARGIGLAEDPEPFVGPPTEKNIAASREALELMRAYARIGDINVRRRLFELVKAVADKQGDE